MIYNYIVAETRVIFLESPITVWVTRPSF